MCHATPGVVHVRTAQLLDGDLLPGDLRHDVRPGQEHGAGAAGHHHEVRERRGVDGTTGTGPEDQGDLGDHARGEHVADEDLAVRREAGDPLLDPRPARVVEPDERDAALHGEVADPADLVGLHPRHGPAEDGEVLGEHGDAAAVDLAEPGHHTVARKPLAVQPERRLAVGGERAHLLERAVVQQQGEALAGRELAARVLGLDALRPTTLHGARAHRPERVEMFGHAWSVRPMGRSANGRSARAQPADGGGGPGHPGSARRSEPPPDRNDAS